MKEGKYLFISKAGGRMERNVIKKDGVFCVDFGGSKIVPLDQLNGLKMMTKVDD